MHKYIAIFLMGLKNALEYRGALLTWILVELMTLTSALFLWTGVFQTHTTVGIYQYQSIILYYFLVPLVGAITSAHISDKLPRKIKDGEITKDLVKPYSFLLGFIINQFAIKTIQNTIKFPIYFIVGVILFSTYKIHLQPMNVVLGLGAAVFGYILHITLDTAISLSAFWFDDTWSLSLLKFVALMIFGGLSFPIDLIPNQWRLIYTLLPFDMVYYYPVSVMMGKISTAAGLGYALKFLLWFGSLFVVIRFLWRAGTRKYGVYGH